MPNLVYVLDANALIDMKKAVPTAKQWDFFVDLADRVDAGGIAIPSHVIREVGGPNVPHPDMPGGWAKGMERRMQHPLEADQQFVGQVMTTVPTVLDHDADTEQADPYVLALALHLTSQGHKPVVITKDKKDRPGRISLRTACLTMGVKVEYLETFIEAVSGS